MVSAVTLQSRLNHVYGSAVCGHKSHGAKHQGGRQSPRYTPTSLHLYQCGALPIPIVSAEQSNTFQLDLNVKKRHLYRPVRLVS